MNGGGGRGRTIAHMDADAFYVSVELQRRPELRGLPVVISSERPRAVVTTASYEARRFGVGSAMPAVQARRLCPQAVFVAPDFTKYRQVSQEMMALVRGAAQTVEVVGLDEAYLDLTPLHAPKAAMRRLVKEIESVTGIACSVGIGPNRLVAKVASDAEKPRGFVVLTEAEARERFGQMSPNLIPGIGPKTAGRLEQMGVTSIAKLAATPQEELTRSFGQRHGPYLVRRACFLDDGPVGGERVAVSESRETTFLRDVADRDELERRMKELTERLCEDLVRRSRRGRTVAIKVRLDDFTTVTRAHTLEHPVNDPALVFQVACHLLSEYDPPRPVRLIGVRVAGLAESALAGEGESGTQLRLV